MKYQVLFSQKNNENIYKTCLLVFLVGSLRVKYSEMPNSTICLCLAFEM